MNNIVITGGTRGLGLELARCFLESGQNVTLSGKSAENLRQATTALGQHADRLLAVPCDVRDRQQIEALWRSAVDRWGRVDVWINNAGINQPGQALWELSPGDTNDVLDTNLRGMVFGSQIAMQGMSHQGSGQIYNVEGFGSNGMKSKGQNLYATTKSALTFFTQALAAEAEGTGVQVGRLSPGMMVTDFIVGPVGQQGQRRDNARTRRAYNILGDKPATVAAFLAPRVLANRKNNVHIAWLTNGKVAWRFLTAAFTKRDLFEG